jgi:hypothetical protein
MGAEPGSAEQPQGRGTALVEWARLSRAQRDAAVAGRFDEVRSLLGVRRRLLGQIQGRGVPPEEIDTARTFDTETRRVLEAQIRRVGEELSRLTAGSRALSGYVVRARTFPAFVDHVR